MAKGPSQIIDHSISRSTCKNINQRVDNKNKLLLIFMKTFKNYRTTAFLLDCRVLNLLNGSNKITTTTQQGY